jgi:hypothetical protein
VKVWTRQQCPVCNKHYSVNNDRRMSCHPRGVTEPCAGSGQQVDVRYRLGAWR